MESKNAMENLKSEKNETNITGLSSFEEKQEGNFPPPPPPLQNEIFGYQSVARNSRMLYFHWLLD